MFSVKGQMALERLQKSFTPHAPIHLPEFLMGRLEVLYKANDAASTEGLHVILYGDRGIGKTSIARVLGRTMQEPERKDGRRCIYVSCDTDETYSSIWRKVFQEVWLAQRQLGFGHAEMLSLTGRWDVEDKITNPNDVRLMMQSLPNPNVIIIDEFDRVPENNDTRRLMSDTIKLFADSSVNSTIVLVGVAESISDLLVEHQSIARNIAQIPVEPMTLDELSEIIQKGFTSAGQEYEPGLDRQIAVLSQGYPHYTHLLGLWAGRVAAERNQDQVTFQCLEQAIPRALENIIGGVQQEYEKGVASSHPDNLFKPVLLACAMAKKDSLGRFAASDLREPLREILDRDLRTVAYQGHLAKFCESARGPVLRRTGLRKSFRWQFVNPQLIPYIRLQGVQGSLWREDSLTST